VTAANNGLAANMMRLGLNYHFYQCRSTRCCEQRIILKIHSPYFLLSKISLTKIVAYAIQFLPQSRHNFSRLCGFSTLADNFSTNNMHRQTRRGGVVHGGQR
jgi:hypothetical protein